MPWIPESFIDELLSRTSIEEVISEYVPLERKGNRYWGRCPFHNEKTASFTVNVEEQFYYCFGCHASGSVFRFIQEMEHLDFPEAVRFLADRAHMPMPEERAPSGKGGMHASTEVRDRICEANVTAARWYHGELWKPENAQILNYLYTRGLNDTDIRHFGLGAAPAGKDALLQVLRDQGFEDGLLQTAGLAVERDGKLVDMFRNRAIFPIINPQGKVVGFGGRAMGDAQPKYLNTADTPVFNKRKGLYALNFAKKERDAGHLVLVEGYMDAVSLRKHGVRGVVATLGTALTEEQAMLIKRQTSEIWVSYDGDAPGQKAALRALDIFEKVNGLTAKVIDYPAGQDPDDFIRTNGLEGFEKLPRYDAAEYRMLRAQDGLDLNTQEGITEYALRCCQILRRVKDPIRMENYLRTLIQQTGYDHDTLLRQIGTAPANVDRPGRELSRRNFDRKAETNTPSEERALLTLFAQGLIPAELIDPEDFSEGVDRELASGLLEGRSVAVLLEGIEDDAQRAQAAFAVNYSPLPEGREDCMKLAQSSIMALRRRRMNKRMAEIEEEIKHADPSRKAELYQQMQRITQAIEEE